MFPVCSRNLTLHANANSEKSEISLESNLAKQLNGTEILICIEVIWGPPEAKHKLENHILIVFSSFPKFRACAQLNKPLEDPQYWSMNLAHRIKSDYTYRC